MRNVLRFISQNDKIILLDEFHARDVNDNETWISLEWKNKKQLILKFTNL